LSHYREHKGFPYPWICAFNFSTLVLAGLAEEDFRGQNSRRLHVDCLRRVWEPQPGHGRLKAGVYLLSHCRGSELPMERQVVADKHALISPATKPLSLI